MDAVPHRVFACQTVSGRGLQIGKIKFFRDTRDSGVKLGARLVVPKNMKLSVGEAIGGDDRARVAEITRLTTACRVNSLESNLCKDERLRSKCWPAVSLLW